MKAGAEGVIEEELNLNAGGEAGKIETQGSLRAEEDVAKMVNSETDMKAGTEADMEGVTSGGAKK